MTVHVFASAKGSPGVTASVLALATVWPAATGRQVLVVDADPAGSGILPGYLRATSPSGRGLVALAAVRPNHLAGALFDACLRLDQSGDVLLLPGLTDPAQATALTELFSSLPSVLGSLHVDGVDVLIDAGRLDARSGSAPLIAAANARVLVARSSLVSLASVGPVLDRAHRAGQVWRVLVLGPGRPYSTTEVAAALKTAEPVLEQPWDPRAAATFSDGTSPGWRHDRSPFMRAARALARHLSNPDEATDRTEPEQHPEPPTLLTDTRKTAVAP